MKITFIIPYKKQETTEIDENASGEEVKELLISKFQFPEGKYTFIYFGNFLPDENTFKSLPETGAKVVILIKTPEELRKEEEIEKKKAEAINSANRRIESFIDISQIEALYSEPDIWNKIPEMATMSRKIQESQNLFQLVYHDVKHTVCPGRDPNSVLSIMLSMLDYSIDDHLPPMTDIDAEINDLAEYKRKCFNQLEEYCSQHEEEIGAENCRRENILKVLKEKSFYVNRAKEALLQMGKKE